MLRKLILITSMLVITYLLLGTINPASMLTGIPACKGFAGESAMQVNDGITHLTYLGTDNRIIYVCILADNTYQYHEVAGFAPSVSVGLPTLDIETDAVAVYYSGNNVIYRAITENLGSSFDTSEIEAIHDEMPIIKQGTGTWKSFITPYDTYADSSHYQYFSNIDRSTNDTMLPFWGPDVVSGAVRSNTDIWIKQSGGGTNNGWPTFYEPVYTAGQIQSISGTPPYNLVFLGGLYEHVPTLTPDIQTMKWQIQKEASFVYPTIPSENKIVFVTVNGSNYTSMIGTITEVGADTIDVWTLYPPRTGQYLFRNRIAVYDTLWTPGPSGSISNCAVVVNAPLWIKGYFAGKQTWYSPYDIKICGNISLMGTPMGQAPDPDLNQIDYVALVSDGKIEVQYGYKSPYDSLRYKPNCGSDQDGVFIYASLYALHDDPTDDMHKDGCFTFEYQHPHPSTPAVILSEYPILTWDNIDLHRRKYPQTETSPWPGNIDYPYYNPLWPERYPTMERGTIHLYGSVYQQRRGFIHRNISDSEYPNPNNSWDIENDYCGAASGTPVTDPVLGFTMQGVNATGATGTGVGYKKDFHTDTRLNFNTYNFNPFGLGMRYKTSEDGTDWAYKYYKSLNEPVLTKSVSSKYGKTALHLNNHILWQSGDESNIISPVTNFTADEKLMGIKIYDDSNLLVNVYKNNASNPDSLRVFKLNPVTNDTQPLLSIPVISKVNTLYDTNSGMTCFANLEADGSIRFYAPDLTGNLQSWSIWNPQIGELASMQIDLEKSRLTVLSCAADTIYVMLSLSNLAGTSCNLYYAKGGLTYTSNEDVTEPELQMNVKLYPNPFKRNLTLNIGVNKQVEADIAVYNIKGQMIKKVINKVALSKGEHRANWDGKDKSGKPVGNGIYFIQGNIGNNRIMEKILMLK